MERLTSDMSEHTIKYDELEKLFQATTGKVKDLESKLRTSSTEHEKYETERRSWVENQREKETAKTMLEQKVLQLETKFRTADSERKELKGKVFALQDEISDLEFKLESKTSEGNSLEAQVKILSEKYENSLEENSRINSQASELRLSLESNQRDLRERDEEIKYLTDTKARVENEMASLKENMFAGKDSGSKGSHVQVQEKLQRELLDAHKAVSELEVRVKKAETGENRTREELSRKMEKMTSLEVELDEVKLKYVQQMKQQISGIQSCFMYWLKTFNVLFSVCLRWI